MITLDEQIAEANRELALRRASYPGLVEAGRLSEEQARYQIRCMWAIVTTLRRLEVEQRQLSFFGETP